VLLVDDPEPRDLAGRVGRDVLDLEQTAVGVAAAAVPGDVDAGMAVGAERRALGASPGAAAKAMSKESPAAPPLT
jgi:hypothetical protein